MSRRAAPAPLPLPPLPPPLPSLARLRLTSVDGKAEKEGNAGNASERRIVPYGGHRRGAKADESLRLPRAVQTDGSCWLVSVVCSLRLSGMWHQWFLATPSGQPLGACQFFTSAMVDAYVRRTFYSGACIKTDSKSIQDMLLLLGGMRDCDEPTGIGKDFFLVEDALSAVFAIALAAHAGRGMRASIDALHTAAGSARASEIGAWRASVAALARKVERFVASPESALEGGPPLEADPATDTAALVRLLFGIFGHATDRLALQAWVQGLAEAHGQIPLSEVTQAMQQAWGLLEPVIDLGDHVQSPIAGRLQQLGHRVRLRQKFLAIFANSRPDVAAALYPMKGANSPAMLIFLPFSNTAEPRLSMLQRPEGEPFTADEQVAIYRLWETNSRRTNQNVNVFERVGLVLRDLFRRLGSEPSIIKDKLVLLLRAIEGEEAYAQNPAEPSAGPADPATIEAVRTFYKAWGDTMPAAQTGIGDTLRQLAKSVTLVETRASLFNSPSTSFAISSYVGPLTEAFVRASTILHAGDPLAAASMAFGGVPAFAVMGLLRMNGQNGPIYALADPANYHAQAPKKWGLPVPRLWGAITDFETLAERAGPHTAVMLDATAETTFAGPQLAMMDERQTMEEQTSGKKSYMRIHCAIVTVRLHAKDALALDAGPSAHAIGLAWDPAHSEAIGREQVSALLRRMDESIVRQPGSVYGGGLEARAGAPFCVFGDDFRSGIRELLPDKDDVYVMDPNSKSTKTMGQLVEDEKARWARELMVAGVSGPPTPIAKHQGTTVSLQQWMNRFALDGVTLVGEWFLAAEIASP